MVGTEQVVVSVGVTAGCHTASCGRWATSCYPLQHFDFSLKQGVESFFPGTLRVSVGVVMSRLVVRTKVASERMCSVELQKGLSLFSYYEYAFLL